jgi:hypothetical protein
MIGRKEEWHKNTHNLILRQVQEVYRRMKRTWEEKQLVRERKKQETRNNKKRLEEPRTPPPPPQSPRYTCRLRVCPTTTERQASRPGGRRRAAGGADGRTTRATRVSLSPHLPLSRFAPSWVCFWACSSLPPCWLMGYQLTRTHKLSKVHSG